MKKKYQTPEIEIIQLQLAESITDAELGTTSIEDEWADL